MVFQGQEDTFSIMKKHSFQPLWGVSKCRGRQTNHDKLMLNPYWHHTVRDRVRRRVVEKGGLCPRWVSERYSISTVQVLSLWWRRSVHPGHHRQSPCPSSHASTSRPGRSGYSPPQPHQRQC